MTDFEQTFRSAYAFDKPSIELGHVLRDGTPNGALPIRIPLAMMNRHGLIAGATGTGKTKTLQLLAGQLSKVGVPCFVADIKGVGSEYSDLLERAGVDTVVELATRNAANLSKQIKDLASKTGTKVVRRIPSEREITSWVSQAKKLPRAVEY